MNLDDFRQLALRDWLQNSLLLDIIKLEPASSDASFRRYFRATLPEQSMIVMDAPPDRENLTPFLKVAGLMAAVQVNVPDIYHQNLEEGFLALEDFGSASYQDHLCADTADALYADAMDMLFQLQTQIPVADGVLPFYDEALLQRELQLFSEWFAGERLAIELPEPLWRQVRQTLIDSALSQPITCVHRDFHSRNLMTVAHNNPGVIDFQDAVFGPVTYDLVSLLRDCYIAWPEDRVIGWLTRYYERLYDAGIVVCSLDQFKRWFDLMGMQRHLKAIGIFSRLDLRDGKPGYLKDIPRTLNYVSEQCARYPELHAFGQFLSEHIQHRLPAYA
jgi:N-acetylmuramate 1-kinase